MRKILLYLLLLNVFYSFAQNPILTSKKWFLEGGTNVDLDAVRDNINFPYVELQFFSGASGLVGTSNYIAKSDCQTGYTAHVSYTGTENGNSSFTFTDFSPFLLDSGCENTDLDMLNLMDQYKSFFNDYVNDAFTYNITDVYGVDHIQIENSNGDVLWFTENPFEWAPDTLTAQDWNLQKIIIDGSDIVSPDYSIEGKDDIKLLFFNYFEQNSQEDTLPINTTFETNACYAVNSMISFDTNENQFYLYSYGGTTDDCGNATLSDFSNQYMGLYLDNLPGPFSYEFATENGDNVLIITNSVGNKAVYTNSVASVNEVNSISFNIYPNPSSKKMSIQSNYDINTIEILNYLGQSVSKYTTKDINISNLNEGIYFIEVQFTNKQKITKKFIKL